MLTEEEGGGLIGDSDDEQYQYRGMSFSEMEKREAAKAADSLISIDDRLYSMSSTMECTTVPSGSRGVPKYYSEGYEANHEGVDDREIACWRKAFPYLRISGHSVGDPTACVQSSDVTIYEENPHYVDDYHEINEAAFSDLSLTGKAINPTLPVQERDQQAVLATEGEIIEQHGVLEEFFDINQEGDAGNADENLHAMEPSLSQREEVLQSLVALCWDDIVDTLQPLVRRVVEAARENNIPYKIENRKTRAIGDRTSTGDGFYKSENIAVSGFNFASDSDESSGW